MLAPARTYGYCMWARLGGAPPPASAIATLRMLQHPVPFGAAGWTLLASKNVSVTPPFQQFCLGNLTVAAATNVSFTLTTTAAARYYIDDASLTYTAQ